MFPRRIGPVGVGLFVAVVLSTSVAFGKTVNAPPSIAVHRRNFETETGGVELDRPLPHSSPDS